MRFWTFLKILKSHFFKKVIFLFFWLFQFFDFLGYLNYSKSRQSWRVSVCHFTNWHIRGWLFIHSSLRQQRDPTFTHLYPSIHRTYTHLFTYFKCFPSVSPHPPRTLAITHAEGYYPIHTLCTLHSHPILVKYIKNSVQIIVRSYTFPLAFLPDFTLVM